MLGLASVSLAECLDIHKPIFNTIASVTADRSVLTQEGQQKVAEDVHHWEMSVIVRETFVFDSRTLRRYKLAERDMRSFRPVQIMFNYVFEFAQKYSNSTSEQWKAVLFYEY